MLSLTFECKNQQNFNFILPLIFHSVGQILAGSKDNCWSYRVKPYRGSVLLKTVPLDWGEQLSHQVFPFLWRRKTKGIILDPLSLSEGKGSSTQVHFPNDKKFYP